MTAVDQRTKIELLLRYCDPEGDTKKRLQRYLQLIEERCFLGPAAERFIEERYRYLVENVECRYLATRESACRAFPGETCAYTDRFRACLYYKSPAPGRVDSVLGDL